MSDYATTSGSLTGWMDAMVALRRQKAQEQQFRAREQDAMYGSLGEGIGGLLGGLERTGSRARTRRRTTP